MTSPMRWRMIGYMAALFVAGAITGAAVMAHSAGGSQTLKVGRTDEIEKILNQRLIPLELTPDQRQKIDPLVRKASETLEQSHHECLDQCSVAIDNLHAQIRSLLTAEQLDKFKEMEAERQAAMLKKYNYVPQPAQASKP